MAIKRIAFVVKYFPTVSETFIVNQINGLIDAGLHVDLYAYNQIEQQVLHASLKRYNLITKVCYFVKPPISKWRRLQVFIVWIWQHRKVVVWGRFFKTLNVFRFGKDAYTLKLFFEAQWFLVPYHAELIHAHFGMVGNRIAYLKAKTIIQESVPLITSFHGYDLEPKKLQDYKTDYKYLFNEAAVFTVNTIYLEKLLQQVNSKEKATYILPVGLDTQFFKRSIPKNDNSYFDLVFCGKLISLKGPDLGIDILKKLHDNGYVNTRLHIIGDGAMREELKRKIEYHQLEASIFLYGSQSQLAIKQIFQESDVFVLPGRYDLESGRAETQGLVIQEAQSMELPVIVSDVGGMKYGLLPNKSGFVVNEGDLNGFCKAIETLILDNKFKLKMGKRGRQFVQERHDNEVLLDKLLTIYKTTLNISLK